jgi:hypothetical protein
LKVLGIQERGDRRSVSGFSFALQIGWKAVCVCVCVCEREKEREREREREREKEQF